jgi:hypothetical protein
MLDGLRKLEGILPEGCFFPTWKEDRNIYYDNVHGLANIYLKENFQHDRVQERFELIKF